MKKLLLLTLLVSTIIVQAETQQEVTTQIEQTEMQQTQSQKAAVINEIKLQLSGWAISQELFDWICQNFPQGSVIVECGSGIGSLALARAGFTVYSIEHDHRWLNKYEHENIHYIYAPITCVGEDLWYTVELVKKGLPEKYDLILVDGPTGWIGRHGFLKNIELFNSNLTIIFDDIDRPAEKKLFQDTQDQLQRQGFVLKTDGSVGIISAK